MNGVNTLVICKDNYEDDTDFELAVGNAVMFLMKNEYIMTVQYEEPEYGIVRIDYEHDHKEWGCRYPHWLSPDEEEIINDLRESDKE